MNSIRSYMTYRFLSISSRFKRVSQVQLGRWKIEDTECKRNIKIDYSNNDNCFMTIISVNQEDNIDEYLKYMI
jgi:hypothetical protein